MSGQFTFVQKAGVGGTAATAQVTLTSVPTQGNLLIVDAYGAESSGGAAFTMQNAGWTQLDSQSGSTTEISQWWKIAGASEPTAISLTPPTGAIWDLCATEYSYTGITLGTPLGNAVQSSTGASRSTPIINVSASGPVLVHCAVGIRGASTVFTSQSVNGSTSGVNVLFSGATYDSLCVFDMMAGTSVASYVGSLTLSNNTTTGGSAAIAVFSQLQVQPAELIWTGSEVVDQPLYVWDGTTAN